MDKFPPFFFDGNQWFGLVDSPGMWKDLVKCYLHYLHRPPEVLLETKIAPLEEIGALPLGYFFGHSAVLKGQIPSFGWRREHTGEKTLGEWAKEQGVDLLALLEASDV